MHSTCMRAGAYAARGEWGPIGSNHQRPSSYSSEFTFGGSKRRDRAMLHLSGFAAVIATGKTGQRMTHVFGFDDL